MSAVIPLARLDPVAIRTAWPDEARNFTPWLADNLDLLGEAVGLDLVLEGVEVRVGPFSADILAREAADNRLVLIENQCAQTDHRHLGQILTYMAGLDAAIAIWVTESFHEQHRAAVDHLNRVTSEEVAFFGVEVRLFRVGDNHVPQFDVVAKPNDWARGATQGRRSVELSETAQQWEAYWTEVAEGVLKANPNFFKRAPSRAGWQIFYRLHSSPSCTSSVWAWLDRNGSLRAYVDFSGIKAKIAFDRVRSRLKDLKEIAGCPLTWDRRDDKKSSYVFVTMPGTQSHLDESQRGAHIRWLNTVLPALVAAFQPAMVELDRLDDRGDLDTES